MLLSDHDILKAHDEGHIDLTPWTPEMVQPASIDVRPTVFSAYLTTMLTRMLILQKIRVNLQNSSR